MRKFHVGLREAGSPFCPKTPQRPAGGIPAEPANNYAAISKKREKKLIALSGYGKITVRVRHLA